ncbi:glycerol dehydrogenase [Rhizobiaceae bacterium BDR2-2]|uniref:Glycerol dehydrogenase n=1 Tax=Ectorhizobium quercum TaxID=2965071 RepID=A0AAE3N1N3_9HYPH|nr:glycerol dehydrogenase [Ectorhizobium quercum]MCX8997097.1 glycerol dehydrogenase [Ectorhizobium quercum]
MMIFGSPARYIQGPGLLAEMGPELARLSGRATMVVDSFIEDAYGEAIAASCRSAGVELTLLTFGGESSPEEVDRLAALAGEAPPVVAAAGGGKCIDAGKALANRSGAAMVTIPTVASTDAPTSHNYVLYGADHRMLGVEKLRRNPDLVLVDTEIIVRAPKQMFLGGIGDTIGKIYEVEACARNGGVNVFGGTSAWSARVLARASHDILLRHAEDALGAIDRGKTDPVFEMVVEATVLMSGLAFESGGLSIAHSMTRGLTALAPWKERMHGHQVAYANLVQIALEDRPEAEIGDLAAFYGRIGLPRSLAELGGVAPSEETFETIARLTMTAPHIRHFPRTLSAREVAHAMRRIEAMVK